MTGRWQRSWAAAGVVLLLAACGASGSGGGHGSTAGGAGPATAARSAASGTGASGTSASDSGAAATSRALPRPAHVVVVMEENHSYSDIIASPSAPYLNALARSGASLTSMYAITHPSQPNYVALFSGSTHGLDSDACPQKFTGTGLAGQLLSAHDTFAGYSEGLPRTGSTTCSSGSYARKHNPWSDFPAVPSSLNRPFTSFPTNYAALPSLSFVIPDLDHDMHDGTIAQADSWLRSHLGGYAAWARTHDSLLVITWDEDDDSAANHIPTILYGAHVRTVRYKTRTDTYGLLRTLDALFRLPALGAGRSRSPITGIWSG